MMDKIKADAVLIQATRGVWFMVDAEDEALVRKYSWTTSINSAHHVYAKAHPKGQGRGARGKIYLHRLVIGALPGQVVDHINALTTDCRKCNLRIVTSSQNLMNRRRTRSLLPKGVKLHRGGVYLAQIILDKKVTYLGLYSTPEEAGLAYDRAAEKLFGEYSRLNYPERTDAPVRLNRIPCSKTGFHGVHARGSKFIALASVEGRVTYLGTFLAADEAAHAYDSCVTARGLKNARLNFPESDGYKEARG